MAKKISRNTFLTDNSPSIKAFASIAGSKESEGPIGTCFDKIETDSYFGQDTWEKAESELQKQTVGLAISKAGLKDADIDYILSGDLINQCIGTTYGLRSLNIPFLGIYGACSTMAEGLLLGSLLTDSGIGGNIAAATSSHFSTAERQFRFPLSYGGQRTPSAQGTCTASGAVILSPEGGAPYIRGASIGTITDLGITDANNMGAAMAPAALDTLVTHLQDTGRQPSYYDAIITGDLGYIGKEILQEMAQTKGYNINANYDDCGVLMFDKQKQDTHSGGSGCACIATVFSGYFYKQLKEKKMKKILLIATGALMNSTSMQQGETIPGIAHAISIEI